MASTEIFPADLSEPSSLPPDPAARGEQSCSTSESTWASVEADLARIRERALTALVRGAAAGFALRGGLHLLSKALSLVSARRSKKTVLSGRHPLEETARYTAFLGALGGVYVAVDEGLALWLGKKKTAKWRALVAGLCAGPSILLTGSDVRHNSLSLYIFLRGLTLLIRCGNKPSSRAWLRALLAPTRFEHGDTLMMCLASYQILYSFIVMPHTMPKSYVHFLQRHALKAPYVWEAIRELLAHNATSSLPATELQALKGTGHIPICTRVPCSLLHPSQSCAGHIGRFLPAAYIRALPVYLPVYLIPALLVHRKRLWTEPLAILPRVLLGTLRSSGFLALYIGCALAGACSGHSIFGTTSGVFCGFLTSVAGLATLVEKKSRRMELALYCASRAIQALFECMVEWGYAKPFRFRMDVVLFSIACGAIMHCYSGDEGRHRDTFRSKYLNVLDFVYGNSGLNVGRIKHIPSNQDLLQTLHQRNGWVSQFMPFLGG
ncbi:hypothetical protein BSKO_07293 [Bryopsis sp. KO-2023]|nr:hypothetical protein BSKO_07293 [Bryopsis sp. KO-2023]